MAETPHDSCADEAPGWLVRGVTVHFDAHEHLLSAAELLVQVAALEPGGEAISLLQSLAGRALTDDERLTVVQMWQPLVAWACGQELAAVAELAGPEPEPVAPVDAVFTVEEPMAYELAPAIGISVDFAKSRLRQARLLAADGRFAGVGELLRSGTLSDYKTRILLRELEPLAEDVAATVLGQVLAKAAGLSPTQLTRALRRAVKKALAKADPLGTLRAFVEGRRTRGVHFDQGAVDGLVLMTALLPPIEALAMQRHLEAAAGGRDGFDGRCKDERMADLLTAAVLGSAPGDPTTPLTPKIVLQIEMDLPSLFGLRNKPGELLGHGDLPAELVRALAGDAAWQRLVFDPVDGHLLDLGKHRYPPDLQLGEYVRSRDRFCRFPFSSRSAASADLDHLVPFDQSGEGKGGSTSADNLGALSRGPHRAKTHGGHTVTHLGNGIMRWETPLGRAYVTCPHDYRAQNDERGTSDTGDAGDRGDDPPGPGRPPDAGRTPSGLDQPVQS